MVEFVVRGEEVSPILPRRMNWSAVWAGVFVFTSIWTVFGALGVAIFMSAVTPAQSAAWGVALAIWEIVLTVVAMYIAGLETGRLAAIDNRHSGVVCGMTMFGLSLITTAVIAYCAAAAGFTLGPAFLGLSTFAGFGWIGFLALFFGWIGAMAGASSGVAPKAVSEVREIRPAA